MSPAIFVYKLGHSVWEECIIQTLRHQRLRKIFYRKVDIKDNRNKTSTLVITISSASFFYSSLVDDFVQATYTKQLGQP